MNSRAVTILLAGVLTAVALVTAACGRFDDGPTSALEPVDSTPDTSTGAARTESDPPIDVPDIAPLDVAALDISLQIDRSRAPLSEVAEQFRSRVAAAPDDHISRTILASTLLELARETADLGIYSEAEAVIDRAIDLAPESTDAQLVMAQAESSRHDFSSALVRAEEILDASPSDLGALAVRGDAAFELGDIPGATADFEQLHAAAPSAASLSRLARLAQSTGDPAGAIQHSLDALRVAQEVPLRPGSAAFYWFQLGSNLFEAGDVDGAAAALEQALDIDPTHPGSTELLAHVRTAQGRIDDAMDIFRTLLDRGPAADLHGELAVLLRISGNNAEADAQIAAGRSLAEQTLSAYPAERRHIAGFLVTVDPITALELAEQDIATREDVYSYDMLAWTLLANDRADEADVAMRSALAEGTVDADLYFHAGAIAEARGEDGRAVAFLEAALEVNPAFDPVDAPHAVELLERLAAG